MTARRYRAFLSYSHAVDGRLAPALQTGLHRLAKPWYRAPAFSVFRDKTSLAASPQLWSDIEDALRESEFFVLLASPAAAASPWVAKEVDWWLTNRAADRILVVLTDGTLGWDAAASRFAPDRSNALPGALLGAFAEEPLWVDLRWARTADDVSLHNPTFQDAVADLAAPLHGVGKELLVGADVRQHRRTMRTARSAVALLLVLTTAAGVGAWVAVDQRDAAQQQARLATSRQLAGASTQALETAPRRSLLLGLEALTADDTPEARSSVLAALHHDEVLTRYLPGTAGHVAFSPVGGALASGTEGVQLWSTDPWQPTVRLGPERRPTSMVAFSPDGTLLAVAYDGPTARVEVWDAAAQRVIASFDTGHPTALGGLVFLRGDVLVTGGGVDPTARAWSARTGKPVGELPDLPSAVDEMVAGPDLRTVAIGMQQYKIALWRVGDPAPPTMLAGPLAGPAEYLTGMAFTPDGSMLLTGTVDTAVIALWDLARGRIADQIDTGASEVSALALSANGSTLAVATVDEIELWDLAERRVTARIAPEGHPFYELSFDPGGRFLAAAGADTLVVSDLSVRADRATVLAGYDPLEDTVLDIAIDSTGTRLASAATDRSVTLWDLPSGRRIAALRGHLGFVTSVEFASAGPRLASGSADGQLLVWDSASGQIQQRYRHGSPVGAVAFGPDGRRLAAATGASVEQAPDPVVTLWDPADQRLVATLHGHRSDITDIEFSPNGRWLASSSTDLSVRLWDAATGEAGPVLVGHEGAVSALSFSPDGHTLATVDRAGSVRLWDVEQARLIRESTTDGGTGSGLTTAVRFSPDGELLYTGTGYSITVWQASDLRRYAEPLAGGSAVAVSPDGRTVAGTDLSSRIIVSSTDPVDWRRWACEVAGRNLSRLEWADFLPPTEPFRPTCPGVPV